jgi:prepilin-type N-terminal cleavage/methylation domain-containing protein
MNQRGFTLVELLITITLISMLSLMMANFVADWLQTSNLAQARTALLSNAQEALDKVSNDIRLSGSADATNRWPDANGPGGNQFGWQSDSDTLVLGRIATTEDNDVIFSDPAQYITEKDNAIYYVSGEKLYRRIIASDDPNTAAITTCPPVSATSSCPADSKVAEDVTAFTVTYYDANDTIVSADEARAVQLSITVSQSKGGKAVSETYATRMVFRNE